MVKTKDLYGITQKELNSIIGNEVHKIICETRIKLLKKKILAVVVRNNPTDLLINDISKAIEHWDHLKQENNE